MINYDVVRHAHAAKQEGDVAHDRHLSLQGIQQSLLLHDRYREEGGSLRLGICSTAPRTLYTLAIASAGNKAPLLQLEELYRLGGPSGAILDHALSRFGDGLRGYLKEEPAFEALKEFGAAAAAAIERKIAELLPGVEDGIIMIVNHAPTANFVAWALSGWKAGDSCLSVDLANGDRLRVCGENVSFIPLG